MIKTVGDLKKVLEQYDDELMVRIDTDKYGFEIDKIQQEKNTISITSNDLTSVADENVYEKLAREEIDMTIHCLEEDYEEDISNITDKDREELFDILVIARSFEEGLSTIAEGTYEEVREYIKSKENNENAA